MFEKNLEESHLFEVLVTPFHRNPNGTHSSVVYLFCNRSPRPWKSRLQSKAKKRSSVAVQIVLASVDKQAVFGLLFYSALQGQRHIMPASHLWPIQGKHQAIGSSDGLINYTVHPLVTKGATSSRTATPTRTCPFFFLGAVHKTETYVQRGPG